MNEVTEVGAKGGQRTRALVAESPEHKARCARVEQWKANGVSIRKMASMEGMSYFGMYKWLERWGFK